MLIILVLSVVVGLVAAEDGSAGWLRYARLSEELLSLAKTPSGIVVAETFEDSPAYIAGQELQRGIQGILGESLEISHDTSTSDNVILISTATEYDGELECPRLEEDGFWLHNNGTSVTIIGANERGVLYGAFEYLCNLALTNFTNVSYAANPSAPIRWVNQWDNPRDGTIERGYAGGSIFFGNGVVLDDLTRVSELGRLLASVRINGIVINNVNADTTLLSDNNIQGLGRIADALRPWGVHIALSMNFASPQTFGGLATFDPLNADVIQFWNDLTDKIYQAVPDLAGYCVKANSEGQPGPLEYNRTLAQGANLFANALERHGGIVMFRAFVYHSDYSENNWKDDRANAAVEYFAPLDGEFNDNVVVQIKYGPIDFQVREPVSPLFAHMQETSVAMELQITQEYLGQQSHFVYLPPLWKTIMDYDLRVDGETTILSTDILSGKRFNKTRTGYAGVLNVGNNTNWLGSHLAMSNFYAYGRLAWDPTLDESGIIEDWTRLTFGLDDTVVETIRGMGKESWRAYENYTGNLGVQTLTDITGIHYGPNPASQENNHWGQWFRADSQGIGMDRTVWNGTGFSGQYPEEVAQLYESVETTPEDLILWFHHLPWSHTLKSGATIIQHFYDAHYSGAETAASFVSRWLALKGHVDDQRFGDILFRFQYQAGHSIVWRDSITQYFFNVSRIPDELGRVESHPWRIEAEEMQLEGYKITTVNPWETSSGGFIVQTKDNSTSASVQTTLNFTSGSYNLVVGYYDLNLGQSKYRLLLNNETIGEWTGNQEDKLGSAKSIGIDGHSATRVRFDGIDISDGDVIRIESTPNGIEPAPLDYIAILPAGVID
ncbi:hypothetical protein G7054_g8388 [Neopestalotiopsis clavispora]|nr:hypothetical protein G7054_g8388 [Neopestalotiopsis clavispora]